MMYYIFLYEKVPYRDHHKRLARVLQRRFPYLSFPLSIRFPWRGTRAGLTRRFGGSRMHPIFKFAAAVFIINLPLAPSFFPPAAAASAQDPPAAPVSPTVRRPEVCTEQYLPVCGEIEGVIKVFSNACFARAAGAKVVSEPPCLGGKVGPSVK
ncbi:MAG TPA: hypothetical protein VKT70_13375 [Stellaceae bacterium]|nr:hypothetical protein [Stellaceae bacterium]